MPRLALVLPFAFLPALLLTAGVGCSSDDGQVYDAGDPMNHDDEHIHAEADHAEIGPHGGQILELTADHSVHGELVFAADDPARGRFYVLGGDLKTPVSVDRVALFFDDPETGEETNVEADEVSGENGDSEWSFPLNLVPGDDAELAGEIKVTVGENEMEGSFGHDHDEHADHGHGDHDHAGHDHDDADHDAYDDGMGGDEI